MGYFGKLEERELAIKLRRKGLSYKQILKSVSVSKGTISLWCRDIAITPKQMEKLLGRKLKGAERGRIIAAENKHKKRTLEIKLLKREGMKEVGRLSKRDRFVIGISLYAGEGGKRMIQFANSDPRIIKFMMAWFREFGNIPEPKFRGSIWIHDNLDAVLAKEYWSELTSIPIGQFHKTYIAKNKKNSKKVRKNIHEYGVFSVRVSDTKLHRKIMGWLAGALTS